MSVLTYYFIVSRARLLPFLRSDGGEGVWSIELTFLSQLRNLAAGVGMKIRPHVNCEYCYYYYVFYSCVKTKITNEKMIHDFAKILKMRQKEAVADFLQELMHSLAYRPDLGSLSIPHNL